MLWLIPKKGTKLEMMAFKAVVDTLIRNQAECSECRLMLWLIPKEGNKLEMMAFKAVVVP